MPCCRGRTGLPLPLPLPLPFILSSHPLDHIPPTRCPFDPRFLIDGASSVKATGGQLGGKGVMFPPLPDPFSPEPLDPRRRRPNVPHPT